MDFAELATARYSCRSFDPDAQVTQAELDALLEAVRNAPTAKNVQPFRAWVLRSPEAVAKIRECTPCHYNAPLLVLFGAEESEAFARPSDGYNFGISDACIAATQYMLQAADLGLDTCWVGMMDVAKVHELFPETAAYTLVALFPTGHAEPEKGGPADRHTQRKPLAELVAEL